MTLTNTTVSNNPVTGVGNLDEAMTIINSTIVDNGGQNDQNPYLDLLNFEPGARGGTAP